MLPLQWTDRIGTRRAQGSQPQFHTYEKLTTRDIELVVETDKKTESIVACVCVYNTADGKNKLFEEKYQNYHAGGQTRINRTKTHTRWAAFLLQVPNKLL